MTDRFSTLKNKEVVDICSGRILGFVCDIEVDTCTGHVANLIIPCTRGLLGFRRSDDIIIPWHQIKKIGDDIILVNQNSGIHRECC